MKHYGFNFQWLYGGGPGDSASEADEKALDFMAATGFNFVRVPTSYRTWTRDFDYHHPDERVLEHVDRYLHACRQRGLHMSLNLHRAPGYCINRNDLERDNLWVDEVAQEGFLFLWRMFADRYRGVPAEALSFDLLNEPPSVGQYGLTRRNHEQLIRRAATAVRDVDPTRPLVIDGLDAGNTTLPELADLGAVHSGRGYQPMPVSHHRAGWWSGSADAPAPVYPGVRWEGMTWDRDTLWLHYEPWRAVEKLGAQVHIGELGCYSKTPNDVALRWLGDLLGVLGELGWGYAMWNFEGDFGLVGHGRPGARYERLHGYEVDRDLLDLMISNRAP